MFGWRSPKQGAELSATNTGLLTHLGHWQSRGRMLGAIPAVVSPRQPTTEEAGPEARENQP